MKFIPDRAWLICGLAVLGTAHAAPPAHSARPMDAQTRKQMTERVASNHRSFRQPRTMAEGAATLARRPNGTELALVPTELWNTLSVREDADGRLRIVERDAAHPPAVMTGGQAHE